MQPKIAAFLILTRHVNVLLTSLKGWSELNVLFTSFSINCVNHTSINTD